MKTYVPINNVVALFWVAEMGGMWDVIHSCGVHGLKVFTRITDLLNIPVNLIAF